MATHMKETNKNMTTNLLHRISETSEDLKMMEVTDHFELLHELGTGSYGKVFKGKHKTSGQIVAIKMLAKEKTPTDNFLLEYCISLTLSCHRHIILTHEIAFHTSRDFVFVQEMAPAGNLQSIIKHKVGMQEDMLKRCVPQIASALNFMHNSGIVHRDVKLDNILLMDAECHWIKLADFGLTRIQGTLVPSLSWCIPYTAPEFCCLRQGEELILQPSVDVWAFGVLIYIALTGFFPWQAALGRDQQYKEFAWWQVKKDLSEAPGKWKKISTEARGMLWRLLTLNASERCSAMDILNYIHLPWKAEVPSEQIKMNPSFLQYQGDSTLIRALVSGAESLDLSKHDAVHSTEAVLESELRNVSSNGNKENSSRAWMVLICLINGESGQASGNDSPHIDYVKLALEVAICKNC
ncbi:serine/threonine-protein kinase SBK1-like [Bufo gargarizans]|uniref:serine/threonine-protein kinase SBK1-like n=1 Tax=Bufo gargarizans TaxID=30331 RepID=UPI001CF5D5FC|nr:serine/threonine-protein kinase SBK1-like [Bufo gargarizans]